MSHEGATAGRLAPVRNSPGFVDVGGRRAPGLETVWSATARGRIAARSRTGIVVLSVRDVWAFEARDRLCFVHAARGKFDVDVSLVEIQTALVGFIRVHRGWLANVSNIRELDRGRAGYFLVVGSSGGDCDARMRVPVSREHAGAIRARLLAGTVGFRQRRRDRVPSA